MSQEDTIKKLKEPFTYKEIEWKIQTTTNDKARGMAVAYVDSRAIQKRLDDVICPYNWRNEYCMWQDKSQICGVSIYSEERKEWVTKYDGAENTDFEPIKGGLSDAFKRAASLWGIGRYLYDISGVWVDIEQKGKSWAIKQDQFTKLDTAYNQAIKKITGSADIPKSGAAVTPKKEATTSIAGQQQPNPQTPPKQQSSAIIPFDYRVQSIKPSGKSSSLLELVDRNGELISAYIKNSDTAITAGACLQKVELIQKESSYGPYNLINNYELAA